MNRVVGKPCGLTGTSASILYLVDKQLRKLVKFIFGLEDMQIDIGRYFQSCYMSCNIAK